MRPRIAWIEDDIDILFDLRQSLQRSYELFEFRTFNEAVEGMDIIRSCNLILLDVILPSGDITNRGKYLGLELARKMRRDAGIKAPILLHSVLGEENSVVRQRELRELNVSPLDKLSRIRTVHEEIDRHLSNEHRE